MNSYASNNEALLERLLHRGADPNALSNIGETPLTIAVREGSCNAVQRLLEAGGDVNQGDLLHAAVEREHGRAEMMDLLVGRGIHLDTIQYQHPIAITLRAPFLRGTALHKSCIMGRADAVRTLLRHGADPFSKRQRYQEAEDTTPLDIARQQGRPEIVGLFKGLGAVENDALGA